jgi:prepilin signal peptidase PulO-like enzyme (type II secretory pathway)
MENSQILEIFNQLPAHTIQGLVIVFGLAFGSFASLLSYRLVSKEPIFCSRSKCPKCHKTLGILSLVPVLSFLWQKGKCKNCKAKISWQYPIIELVFGASFLISFLVLGSKINIQTLLYFAIFLVLALMIIIDLRHYFIPDSCQYALAILAAILLLYLGSSASIISIIGSGLLYVSFGLLLWLGFYVFVGLEAIGIDDLKFFFIAGSVLGIINFLIFILLCGVIGSVFGGLWQKFRQDETFPFAPAMCSALYLCLLFAKNLNGITF